jgi:hypothetical protein
MTFSDIIFYSLKEDLDKIKSLKVADAGSTPLRTRDTYPSTKSSFSEGSVHEIAFKNIVDSQKRHYYVIYRKLTKSEYDSLKNNYKIAASIVPSDQPEHSKDIYYTSTKEYNRGAKGSDVVKKFATKNFIYLSKDQLEKTNKNLSDEHKLELVPLKDIYEKGIGVRNTSLMDYLTYLEDIERNKKLKRKDPTAAKPEKLKIAEFFLRPEIQKYIKSLIVNFATKYNLNASQEERVKASKKEEEVRKNLSDEIKKFVKIEAEGNEDFEDSVLNSLETTLERPKLYSSFEKYYYSGSEDGSATEDPKKSASADVKKEKPAVPTKKTDSKTKGKVDSFITDRNNVSTLRNIIQNYSDSVDDTRDEEDKKLSHKKYYNKMIDFLKSILDLSVSEKDTDRIIEDIKNYIKGFTENPDLYNRIKYAYDKMKQMKSSQRISEDIQKREKQYYAVTLATDDEGNFTAPALDLAKRYDSGKVSKYAPGIYKVFLDKRQAENIERLSRTPKLSGVESIVPEEEYKKNKPTKGEEPKTQDAEKKLRGYRSLSGEKKVRTADDSYFDPTNPKDVAALVGKVQPGDKVYSVNFKIGDKKSEDLIMPLSRIKKLVPDFKIDAGAQKQPSFDFEMEKKRGISKDTGNTIYDTVKGVLKVNSPVPLNEPVKSEKGGPALYFVVNKADKRVIKGFPTEKEADDLKNSLGSTNYITVSKINLPKYGINLTRKSDVSEKNVKEELSKEDEAKLKTQISFVIESDPNDLDKVAQVTGNAVKATFNKEKNELVITLDDNSQATFTGTKSGNVTGVYNPDNSDQFGSPRKINDIKEPLKGVLDRVFPSPATESKLEAYIRTRIRKALQEAGIDQYMGAQGPEVKKKRLEEYMKKYEWGFQDNKDPYVRYNGTEKHSIVNKLVHELGDEGVAIFNSYAPKGYEIARPDDLNDMADSPLGSQMARPFEPNTLTMRGGRVAEADEKEIDSMFDDNVPMDQQLKNAEELASDYMRDRTLSKGIQKNPNLGHVEKTIVKFIQKASEKGARKDIDPKSKILQALQVISDRQMNKYR